MERPPRLRRYLKKDYTSRVEFPVEILGRDNQVRRYPFDDAVRLYHRRIETASLRYADADTVDAEVGHCRLRIDQLRRSYIAAAGAGRPSAASGLLGGPMAADILFFLRRMLGETDGDAASAALVALPGDGTGELWWWSGAVPTGGCTLYAFRLDGEGPPGARLALERELARLRAAERECGAEHLYAGLITADLALLMAGTEPWAGPSGILNLATSTGDDADRPVDPWRAAMLALQEGQVHHALRTLEDALDADPTRRVLARSGAVVAVMAGEPGRAEFIARFGLCAEPGDGLLRYLLALSRCMQGQRLDEAAFGPGTPRGILAMLGALHALGDGRPLRCLSAGARARLQLGDTDWFALRVARAARFCAWAMVLSRSSAAAVVAMSLWLATSAEWVPSLGAALLAAGLAVVADLRCRRIARSALRSGQIGTVRLCPPELLPREVEARGMIPGCA